MVDDTVVSLRATSRRTRLPLRLLTLGLATLVACGVAAATLYIAPTSSIFNSDQNGVPGGICGFVSLPSTNVVGTGSQSGTNYISFNPALSSTAVTQVVTATLNQFGTGASGYEYLIDEVGFGCSVAGAGATIHFTFGATPSTGNAKWIVMEVSFDSNSPGTSPLAGAPCDESGGGLYLPYGATPSHWGTTNYTGGDTYTFSANQTGGVHLTDDGCTANADPAHTTLPNLVIGSALSSLKVFYYVSFAIVGASSSSPIVNPAFTLSFG